MSTHDTRILYASVIDVHALTIRGMFHTQEVATGRCGGGASQVGGRPLRRTVWGDPGGERAAGLRDQAEGPLCISHPIWLLSICTTHIRWVARLHPHVDLDHHGICILSCAAAHTASGVVVYPAQAAEAAAAKRQSSADSRRNNGRSRTDTPTGSADAGTGSTEPADDETNVDAAVDTILDAANAPGSPGHLFGEVPSSQNAFMGPPSTAPLRRAPTQVIMSHPCHHPACE